MTRPPYDAHLCAQDPQAFERGFRFGSNWDVLISSDQAEAIYQAVKDSTNIPFPQTAAKVGSTPTPWVEGFMLGVYGHVALER